MAKDKTTQNNKQMDKLSYKKSEEQLGQLSKSIKEFVDVLNGLDVVLLQKFVKENTKAFSNLTENVNSSLSQMKKSSNIFKYTNNSILNDIKEQVSKLKGDSSTLIQNSLKNYQRQIQNIVQYSESIFKDKQNVLKGFDLLKGEKISNLSQLDIDKILKYNSVIEDTNTLLINSNLTIKQRQELIKTINKLNSKNVDDINNQIKGFKQIQNLRFRQKNITQQIQQLYDKHLMTTKNIKNYINFQGLQKSKEIVQSFTIDNFINQTDRLRNSFANLLKDVSQVDFLMNQMAGRRLNTDGGLNQIRQNHRESLQDLVSLNFGYSQSANLINSLTDNLGSLQLVNKKNIIQAGQLSVVYGMSNEQVSSLLINMAAITGKTIDTNNQIYKFIDGISKANKISSSKVFKDIANHSQYAAKWQKNGAQNIARASTNAIRLGLSLSHIQKISSNILDFQSSIQSQLQARLITGQSIYYNRVRQLGIMGKHSQMLEQISKIVNSVDLDNIFNIQAMQNLTGLSALQLRRLQNQQRLLSQVGSSYSDMISLVEQGMTAQEILKSSNFQQYSQKLSIAVNKLKLSLVPLANTILPILTKVIEFVAKALDNKLVRGFIVYGSTILMGAGLLLKGAILLKGIGVLFKPLFTFSTSMTNLGKSLPKMASAVGGSIKNFVHSFTNIDLRAIGKSILVMGALSISLIALAHTMKQFNQITGTAIVGFGVAMASIIGTLKILAVLSSSGKGWIGVALLGAISLAYNGFGYAIKLVGQGFNLFGQGIKKVIEGITSLTTIKPKSIIESVETFKILSNSIADLTSSMKNFNTQSNKFISNFEKVSKKKIEPYNIKTNNIQISSNINEKHEKDNITQNLQISFQKLQNVLLSLVKQVKQIKMGIGKPVKVVNINGRQLANVLNRANV